MSVLIKSALCLVLISASALAKTIEVPAPSQSSQGTLLVTGNPSIDTNGKLLIKVNGKQEVSPRYLAGQRASFKACKQTRTTVSDYYQQYSVCVDGVLNKKLQLAPGIYDLFYENTMSIDLKINAGESYTRNLIVLKAPVPAGVSDISLSVDKNGGGWIAACSDCGGNRVADWSKKGLRESCREYKTIGLNYFATGLETKINEKCTEKEVQYSDATAYFLVFPGTYVMEWRYSDNRENVEKYGIDAR